MEKEKQEALWNNREKYNNLLQIALKGASIKEKMPYRRFLGLSWFFYVFQEVVFLEERSDDFIVCDESLSQKIYGLISSAKKECTEDIVDYFNNYPQSCCVIFCRLNQKGIFNRVKKREKIGKIIPGHRGIDEKILKEKIENQIEVSETALKVLKKRGTNALELDMRNDINENVKKVSIFLEKLINENNN